MTPARDWSPRLWEGLDYFAFWRLLARARFRVGPGQIYIVAIMSLVTFANMVLGWVQHARFGRRIAATPLPASPVFVLGHWRTGTTLLHELLMLDGRFSTPTTHDCFLPCHNLLTADSVKRYFAFAMPKRRPMDNMAAGWDRPQEDEFALALLGQPSPYTDIAFPNSPPLDPGSLDLTGLTPTQLTRWQRTLARFVRTLAARDPRPVVLKSPPHTARIPEIRAVFPAAKFVHIRRDPVPLFASTVNLWATLCAAHGLQSAPPKAQFEAKVIREFRVIYERYFATRGTVPPGHLCEVTYEELTADLVGTLRRVYAELDLGDFAAVEPAVAEYAAAHARYERNAWQVSAADRHRVRANWGDLIEKLGYG